MGQKESNPGSGWGHFTCLCIRNGRGSFLGKHAHDQGGGGGGGGGLEKICRKIFFVPPPPPLGVPP